MCPHRPTSYSPDWWMNRRHCPFLIYDVILLEDASATRILRAISDERRSPSDRAQASHDRCDWNVHGTTQVARWDRQPHKTRQLYSENEDYRCSNHVVIVCCNPICLTRFACIHIYWLERPKKTYLYVQGWMILYFLEANISLTQQKYRHNSSADTVINRVQEPGN